MYEKSLLLLLLFISMAFPYKTIFAPLVLTSIQWVDGYLNGGAVEKVTCLQKMKLGVVSKQSAFWTKQEI